MLSSSPEYDVTLQELLQQHEEQEAAAEEARQLLLESGDDKEIEEVALLALMTQACRISAGLKTMSTVSLADAC